MAHNLSSGLDLFDDVEAYNSTLERAMNRADELVAMKERGLSDAERAQLKRELPVLVRTLRTLLKTQLDFNSVIAGFDQADGSYDNADIDEKLRRQLSALRDLNTDIARGWGTRTIRKVSAWFTEDLPNWFSVTSMKVTDYFRQFLRVAGVAGAVTAVGYMVANKGVVPGVEKMQEHLGVVYERAVKPVTGWFAESSDKLWKTASPYAESILGPTEEDRAKAMGWLSTGKSFFLDYLKGKAGMKDEGDTSSL